MRFSCGDIEDAFFTVEIEEESCKYTAFQTPFGCYEYTRMAQGLKNAATAWAKIIADAFKNIMTLQLFIYQDDVVNYAGPSLTTHLQMQQQIYEVLKDHDMAFKPTTTKLKDIGTCLECSGTSS